MQRAAGTAAAVKLAADRKDRTVSRRAGDTYDAAVRGAAKGLSGLPAAMARWSWAGEAARRARGGSLRQHPEYRNSDA